MTQHRHQIPSLSSSSGKKGTPGKQLTSPLFTLFLAGMFVAILFALMSAKRNWNIANGSMEEDNDVQYFRSPKIGVAPVKRELPQPPPRIEFEEIVEDSFDVPVEILLEQSEPEAIELRTSKIELEAKLPEELGKVNFENNSEDLLVLPSN